MEWYVRLTYTIVELVALGLFTITVILLWDIRRMYTGLKRYGGSQAAWYLREVKARVIVLVAAMLFAVTLIVVF